MREFAFTSPEVFPAIDVRGGRCVRLVRGARAEEIRYDDDPLEAARRWVDAGARCLHVIDLGAAFGEPDSRPVVLAIAAAVDVPVQAGGGLRDEAAVERLLEGGVARVILGTRALRDPEFLARRVARHGAKRVMVAIDCEGERLKVAGWVKDAALTIDGALERVRAAGVDRLLATATDRDGTLGGPRLDLVERLLGAGPWRVVAAGGIGAVAHVEAVLDLAGGGRPGVLEGVVVGRALYEGKVRLEEALALARERRGERKGV